MPIKTILFDLDGTLLPMDQEVFVKTYMKLLAAKMAPYGYDPQLLVKGLWDGTAAMVKNDGRSTNETVFWNTFCALMGRDARKDEAVFEAFYREEFQRARAVCGFAPQAAETVRGLKKRGFRVVLATNPVFPAVATQSRIRWAGLTPEDFDFYTTYENSSFCKPNPAYYREILDREMCFPTRLYIRICFSGIYSGPAKASTADFSKRPVLAKMRPISVKGASIFFLLFTSTRLVPNISPLMRVPAYAQPSWAGRVSRNASQQRLWLASGNPP